MVSCPACHHDNPDDAAFCTQCGARLEAACATCGRASPPHSVFCAGCGAPLAAPVAAAPGALTDPRAYTPRHLAEKILRDRSLLEGERRNVTVLFADTVGFTPLSERLGEEQVYQEIQRCLNCMMEAVYRYEGSVTSFTGDGLMALFGAPIAHEDSARRAVAAALEMQLALDEYAADLNARHGVGCHFRVGLNTGPVVVGKISDNLDMDYTAIGDTVNLASRMESVAAPGSVYLTENTYRHVRDYFECEPLEPLTVKGKSAPVVAYRAVREKPAIRTRLQAAAERGLSPFVGRGQELSTLRGYFDQVKRGQGHVAFVTGEAGLGKSRLLLEFRRSLLDEPVQWLEGHCISYGKKIPYLPISDIVKANFGIEEADVDARIIRRVEEGTAEWQESAKATIPYLKYLLNVDPGDPAVVSMDPMERRAGILDAVRALVIEESARRPVAILIEDLHWADEKSEDAIRALADTVPSSRVLMIITYRAGHIHSLGDRTYFSRLALGFLPPEESATLAERILAAGQLPAGLRDLITEKGEGNPFYIEEVTRSLAESGVLRREGDSYTLVRPAEGLHVPETIQEVILSRIDRLEREARDAIQLASVIGREFTVRLLNRIADVRGGGLDGLLSELKTLELIYEKAYFPELAYMFKHALTHDVAYSTLLSERRRSLHRLVGAAIEELYPDRLVEHYEAVAHHYYEGQQWEKALEYLEKAGDKARDAYATREAMDYYARAIECNSRLGDERPEKEISISFKRGTVGLTIGDLTSAIDDFERMRTVALKMGDTHSEGIALAHRGLMEMWAHQFDQAEVTLREALAIGDGGYADVRGSAATALWVMLICIGREDEAKQFEGTANELAPESATDIIRGTWILMRGMLLEWRGQYRPAIQFLDRWRADADILAMDDIGRQWVRGLSLIAAGEYSSALDVLLATLAVCDRTGEVLYRARILNSIGWVHVELQNHTEALDWNSRSEQAALEINAPDPEIESNARLNLADSLIALGRLDEAETYLQMIEPVVRNPSLAETFALWLYSQHFFHTSGELALARRDHDRALSYAGECINLAESTDRPKNVVKGRRLRGQVLTAQGKFADAEPEIETALAIAKEIGNPPQLWKTCVALGDLQNAQGRAQDAVASYREALTVIDSVAAALEDEKLRQTFLNSPHVQAIRASAAP